MFAFLDITL